MALALVIYKRRLLQTIKNIGHILVSLVTFRLPGSHVTLDNPDAADHSQGCGPGADGRAIWGLLETQDGGLMTSLAYYLRKLARESRGAEIAEAAAVLPLMFMILLGIFWFGQAFSIYGAITRAAQEGARAGSVPYCVTCSSGNSPAENAVTAVQTALVASKLDPQHGNRFHHRASIVSPPVGPVACVLG